MPKPVSDRYREIAKAHQGTAVFADHEEHCDLCFLVNVIESLGGTNAISHAYREGEESNNA